jgi:YggT family protein
MQLLSALYVYFVNPILTGLILLLVINAVLSWLVAFDIVNRRNQFVQTVGSFSEAIIGPLLRPIRSVVPTFNGIDISPILLFLILTFVKDWLAPTLIGLRFA